jgi:hypothetical protein
MYPGVRLNTMLGSVDFAELEAAGIITVRQRSRTFESNSKLRLLECLGRSGPSGA